MRTEAPLTESNEPRGGAVTLRDVAREARVSVTTVSRILNGRAMGVPIREETRTRVLAIASELGYKPNLLARGLRGSRSSLLGVIARDISDPFHIQILLGINRAAHERNYRLFLGHVDYEAEAAIAYGSMFESSHADGIVLIGDLEGGDAALEILASQHRFLAGVTDRTDRRQIPGVYSDSVAGTRLAMEHLWDLGHRSIVCVSDSRTADGRLRIDEYERFMHGHGRGDRIQIFITDQEIRPAYELGQRIFRDLERGGPVTAIYATSDTTAIGLMQAAFQAGIAIPDRVSIVGYDDIDVAPFTIPPLTTVRQGGVEMGRAVTDLLLRMVERNLNREEVSDVVLQPTLVVRQSTAPPPAGR
jgi:LacI family transcriptional regulator